MLRFIAFVFAQRQPSTQAQAPIEALTRMHAWRNVYTGTRLRVLAHGMQPSQLHRLLPSAGVVLGELFVRQRSPDAHASVSLADLDACTTRDVLASEADRLVQETWGDYCAFVEDERAGRVHVLRAPCNQRRCYQVTTGDGWLFFSHPEDARHFGWRARINDDFVRAQALGLDCAHLTPLTAIRSLLRGQCCTIDLRRDPRREACLQERYAWRPFRFTPPPKRESAEALAHTTRALIDGAAATWARIHPRLLLRLSGGLDSSIVLSTLTRAPHRPHIVAYTFFDPKASLDERTWAHLAAQHARCEHIELPLAARRFDLRHIELPLSIEPLPLIEFLHAVHHEQPLAAEHVANAVFTGEGGDSGFGKHAAPLALLQFLRLYGWRHRCWSIAHAVALYTQSTVWQVLARSLRRHWHASPQSHPAAGSHLVTDELRANASRLQGPPHPWLESHDESAELAHQLGSLMADAASADPLALAPPQRVAPLQSQPVVEWLLRIPLYQQLEDGRDRGVARRAFSGVVPASILQRTWKDRAPGYDAQVIEHNREFIRDTLMSGLLRSQGILDARKLEAALTSGVSKTPLRPGEILRHLGLELWAQRHVQSTRCSNHDR